jgi:hypothetical protein
MVAGRPWGLHAAIAALLGILVARVSAACEPLFIDVTKLGVVATSRRLDPQINFLQSPQRSCRGAEAS